jgi:large subunit ribosomal protein L4
MKLNVIDTTGSDTGRKVELNKEIFAIEPNDHAIYLDVKHFLAAKRQGTHKSKERSEINASTKKVKRQKGTGTARAGSVKSPLFKGGGRVFGPRPRDYSFKLNKKVKQLARKSALTYKQNNKMIFAIEDLNFDAPKTKKLIELKNNLKLTDKKLLLVLPEENKNIYLSSRNLKGFQSIRATDLTTYEIMKSSVLLVCESAFDVLNDILKKK